MNVLTVEEVIEVDSSYRYLVIGRTSNVIVDETKDDRLWYRV